MEELNDWLHYQKYHTKDVMNEEKTKNVELLTCPSGDWFILEVNGQRVDSDHSIGYKVWLELLKQFGANVTETMLTDEEMECRD